MQRLKNGIYATAMDRYVNTLYQEIEDDDIAESMYEYWLECGVPDVKMQEPLMYSQTCMSQ